MTNGLQAQNPVGYRTDIGRAENSASESKKFLLKMDAEFRKTKMPIYLALYGVANFFQAKHSFNPITKISYFNKGKEYLEKAVESDPNNLEIRFLRYLSQKKTPKILGYSQYLREDERFLRNNLNKSSDTELITEIKKSLNIK